MAKTATREYELTYIERPPTGGSQTPFDIDKFLGKLGAKVTRLTSLGEKFLSYPIKKPAKGRVVNLVFETEPERLKEIERALRVEDNILRHLIVKEVISPAEKVKPAIKAAERVVESRELEKKIKLPEDKKPKKAPVKPVVPQKERMEVLDEKLDELLGEEE